MISGVQGWVWAVGFGVVRVGWGWVGVVVVDTCGTAPMCVIHPGIGTKVDQSNSMWCESTRKIGIV